MPGMGWQGNLTHSDWQGRMRPEPLRIRTDGDLFDLPSPDTNIHVIRDAATEQQEGPDPNLEKATAKSSGPEHISEAEHVHFALQNDHSPDRLLV